MYFQRKPAGDSLLFKISMLALFVFLIWLSITLSTDTQIEVSSKGGTFTEGIVGTPRFVNPVLAVTRADRDMAALIYDGLMKLGRDGTLFPNIAKSVTVSDDGLVYNVIMKDTVVFHNGTPLTAEDVIFTVLHIQEPALNSPLRANFDRVVVEQIGEYELNFILEEPYAPFIENLTFGILPQHIWKEATSEEFPFSQYNSEPVGAGPYKIAKINRNTSGIPESYVLEPHAEYHQGAPKIAAIRLNFYSNETKLFDAFNEHKIDSIAGLDQASLGNLDIDTTRFTVMTTPLPRTFALFFNQNRSPALRDQAVRHALDTAINKTELIKTVLGGYGKELTSPIPPGFGVEILDDTSTDTISIYDAARDILRDGGWKVSEESGVWEKEIDEANIPLSFSIATMNSPIFEATAEFLRQEWQKIGVEITVKQFEQSDLTQAIIRPRDYEALLLGTDVGRSLDFYSFWHSSQRNDPGLNVALYANITTDSILSEARTNSNDTERKAALARFTEEIKTETPAIFLYTPEFLYIFPNYVTGISLVGLTEPSERFATIHEWYINTETVWPFFED